MSTEILNLPAVTNIVTQSAAKFKEIKETERRLAIASEQFAVKKYNKATIKKLVADVKSRDVALSSLEFDVIKNNVVISPVPTQYSAEIRAILEPLVSRDITANAIEATKKIELTQLKGLAKSAGVPITSFDNLVQRAALEEPDKTFFVVKKEGYIFYVTSEDPGNPGGSQSNNGQDPNLPTPPTEPSILYVEPEIVGINDYVKVYSFNTINSFNGNFHVDPVVNIGFVIRNFPERVRTDTSTFSDLTVLHSDAIDAMSGKNGNVAARFSLVYQFNDAPDLKVCILPDLCSLANVSSSVTNPYSVHSENGAIGVLKNLTFSDFFYLLFTSAGSSAGSVFQAGTSIRKVSLVLDSIEGVFTEDMRPVLLQNPITIIDDVNPIISVGSGKGHPWIPRIPDHSLTTITVTGDSGDFNLGETKRVFAISVDLHFPDESISLYALYGNPSLELQVGGGTVWHSISLSVSNDESGTGSIVKFNYLISLEDFEIYQYSTQISETGEIVFNTTWTLRNLQGILPNQQNEGKYYKISNNNSYHTISNNPTYTFFINNQPK